ncbi:MAG TPA: hypothetical protein VH595_22885 [Verrucomicrobiae bacterium]|nr:hypothetical protein [Verrucomicrobiae bacterium]
MAQAEAARDFHNLPLAVGQQSKKHMFGADKIVTESNRFLSGEIKGMARIGVQICEGGQ